MSFKNKFALIALSAALALYTIAGGWLATRAQQPANDPGAQQKIFESVLNHIQNDYVDEPNMEKVRAGKRIARGSSRSSCRRCNRIHRCQSDSRHLVVRRAPVTQRGAGNGSEAANSARQRAAFDADRAPRLVPRARCRRAHGSRQDWHPAH